MFQGNKDSSLFLYRTTNVIMQLLCLMIALVLCVLNMPAFADQQQEFSGPTLSITPMGSGSFAIITPSNGARFWVDADVVISVNAPQGVQRVEYYANGVYIGQSFSDSNFQFNWTEHPVGDYYLVARAYISSTTMSSSAVGISIEDYFCEDDIIPDQGYDYSIDEESLQSMAPSGTRTIQSVSSPLRIKGGFHIHWYSDMWGLDQCNMGSYKPADVAATYKNLGYDFIAMTEHDHLTPPRPRSSLLTSDFTWIENCEEVTDNDHGHILAIGVNGHYTYLKTKSYYKAPRRGMTTKDYDFYYPDDYYLPNNQPPDLDKYEVLKNPDIQKNIDCICTMGGLAFLAHPYGLYGIEKSKLLKLKGYDGIAIHTTATGRDGISLWNEVLNEQARNGGRLACAYAEEDYTPDCLNNNMYKTSLNSGHTWAILDINEPGYWATASNHYRSEKIKTALRDHKWWSYWTDDTPYRYANKNDYPLLKLVIGASKIEIQSTRELNRNRVMLVFSRGRKDAPWDMDQGHRTNSTYHVSNNDPYPHHYEFDYSDVKNGLIWIRVLIKWRTNIIYPYLCISSYPVGFLKRGNGQQCWRKPSRSGMRVLSESSEPSVVYASFMPDDIPENGYIQAMYDVSGIPLGGAPLTLSYAGEDVNDLGVENLRIFKYNPTNSSWSPLTSTINQTERTVTATVLYPGIYTISAVSVADSQAPQVAWLSPASSATITDSAELVNTASDNVGVSCLTYYLGTREIGNDYSNMDGRWGATVDFSKYCSGNYTLKVVAEDRKGHTQSATRSIILNTTAARPQITMSQPSYDETAGVAKVTGTVSDADGPVSRVNIKLDFKDIGDAEIDYDTGTWSLLFRADLFGPGTHTIRATAQDEYGNESSTTMSGSGSSLALSNVVMYGDPVEPQIANVPILLTALPVGGSSSSNMDYKFEYSTNGGQTYNLLRNYASSNTYTWTPSSVDSYTLRVTARDQGTTTKSSTMTYSIVAALSGVGLTTDPASPQPANTDIYLCATATGGAWVEYKFEVSSNGGTFWTTISDFSLSDCAVWTPTTAGTTYILRVTARERGTTTPTYNAQQNYVIQ